VLGMSPALAFFEAGMLRSKHTLSIISQVSSPSSSPIFLSLSTRPSHARPSFLEHSRTNLIHMRTMQLPQPPDTRSSKPETSGTIQIFVCNVIQVSVVR